MSCRQLGYVSPEVFSWARSRTCCDCATAPGGGGAGASKGGSDVARRGGALVGPWWCTSWHIFAGGLCCSDSSAGTAVLRPVPCCVAPLSFLCSPATLASSSANRFSLSESVDLNCRSRAAVFLSSEYNSPISTIGITRRGLPVVGRCARARPYASG